MAAELHPAALRELREAVDHYEAAVPGLGLDFLDEVEHAANLLIVHPEAGERVRVALRDLRRWPLPRFPFVLFYDLRPHVVIPAIAHVRRKPDYWAER